MYQHVQLIQKAQALGITTIDLSQLMQKPATILEYNGISELIVEGVPASRINVRSQYYCDNKQLTKLAFEALHLPHPRSIVFQMADEAQVAAFFRDGKTYVCKPLDGTNGDGIVTHIRDLETVKKYYQEYKYLNTRFLLEEQVEGEDLRIQVLDGKIAAACVRQPAFVLGNGKDSLEILIEKRRAVMRTQNPGNRLDIDSATETILSQQGISLPAVPKENQKIQLKFVSNMAQGGIATDVTDDIHTFYNDWVNALSAYLCTSYFGLDIMTTDYTQDPHFHASVLEINARAEWLHHTFSERKTHDIAGMILKSIFGID